METDDSGDYVTITFNSGKELQGQLIEITITEKIDLDDISKAFDPDEHDIFMKD